MRKEEGEGGDRGGREWDSFTIILRRWLRGGRGSLVWGRQIEMRQQHSESRMAARVFNVRSNSTRSGLPKRAQWLAAASDGAQTWILNHELIIDDDGGM
jgi:hypothetical protein